jgi:hypothetical protein
VSILGDIADILRAATDLIRELRPPSHEQPLWRTHALADAPGIPSMRGAPQVVITAPHCLYCGALAPWPAGQRCPAFT